MKGVYLKFYAYEFDKYQGMALYEWLLQHGKKEGMKGGSAFRALAGFGRHGAVHEERFFELGANLPLEVVFLTTELHATQFLTNLKKEKLDLFYVKIPAEFGTLDSINS